MNRTRLKYKKCDRDAQINFYTIKNNFNKYYPLPQVRASQINHKFKFVLVVKIVC